MKHLYVTKIIYIDAQNILKIYIKNFFPSDGRGRVNERFLRWANLEDIESQVQAPGVKYISFYNDVISCTIMY